MWNVFGGLIRKFYVLNWGNLFNLPIKFNNLTNYSNIWKTAITAKFKKNLDTDKIVKTK